MDFLVFSHLRWNFVFQRPQHLISRFARSNRVFFWEEPIFDIETDIDTNKASGSAFLEIARTPQGVHTVVPHLPKDSSEADRVDIQHALLTGLLRKKNIKTPVLWYYNPIAMAFTHRVQARAVIYDCMDELSGFRGAPRGLQAAEAQLLRRADLVFSGGQSLYEAKKQQHDAVYCFPSSIDRDFFYAARTISEEPADQAHIPRPRLGYCGVIDERMDVQLLGSVAAMRPDWHFVMIGPVVKISESELPKAPNIHWMGGRQYADLPRYLSGWDVGLLPFARNEATKFISPTKTPEYLAAGLPVVSTSIADVIRPYGLEGLALIADEPAVFVKAAAEAMRTKKSKERIDLADKFLSQLSWDLTWQNMADLVNRAASNSRSSTVAHAAFPATSSAAVAAD